MIVWHYIFHNPSDALLPFQWVSRNRALCEGKHALVKEAEWAPGVVSARTFLLSVWISFVLPREVVKPLVNLKEAVDHATAGNYEIDFDIQGHREVAQLATSIRNLIANMQ
jgi:methyl-accepting chemotaxis protein